MNILIIEDEYKVAEALKEGLEHEGYSVDLVHTGEEDEGGGVIWGAQDKGNYYIARYNPLENNFRIYFIKNEARKILASARIKLLKGKWQEMEIVQNGKHITGYLNGKKLLEVDDNTFTKPGGVGLWTKADAVTSFDDFEVKLKSK